MAIFGPHPLSSQLQVKLPVKLARQLRAQAGDAFYWRVSDEDPSILLLIPEEVMERRYAAGAALEADGRPQAFALDDLWTNPPTLESPVSDSPWDDTVQGGD